MNQIKIHKRKLYLFTSTFPWGSGEKTFILPELKYLVQEYDVTIVSCASDSDAKQTDLHTELPIDIEVIRFSPSGKAMSILYAIKFFFSSAGRREMSDLRKDGFTIARLKDSIYTYVFACKLRAFCKKKGIFNDSDALYYSFWFNSALLALSLEKSTRKSANMKIVSRIHGYDLYNFRNHNNRQPFQRYKRDLCDGVVFASANARIAFEEEFGSENSPNQYLLSRLGVKHGDLAKRKVAVGNKKTIVSCSNVIPLKRVGLIAEALALLERPEIRWVHFGDGPLLKEIEDFAKENELNATFMGFANNDEILDFYKNNPVEAVILLSETEGGCPVCLQEAVSFGIPVVGSNVGGISEIIDGNGFLLESNPSVESVANAILEVCDSDDKTKREMSQRSLEIWDCRFNIEKNKQAFMAALRNIFCER